MGSILGTNETNLITISPFQAIVGPVTLPEGVYGHCTVLVNDKIMLIGGFWMDSGSSVKVLSITSDNGAMEYMTNLKFGRIHHGCATFTKGNKKFVVVAGANRAYDKYYSVSKTSEILDVEENNWSVGPSLPASCEYAKMITSPEGDGAIFIGSSCTTVSDELHHNIIYQLKQLSNGTVTWVTINREFKYQRLLPVIEYIEEGKVNCYPKSTNQQANHLSIVPTNLEKLSKLQKSHLTMTESTSTMTVTAPPTTSTFMKVGLKPCRDLVAERRCKVWKEIPREAKRCQKKFFQDRCNKTCGIC